MENKRIGILTFQNAYNYGAILQLYGLYSFLDKNGYDVKVINYKNEYFANYYIYRYSLFKHNEYSNRFKNILKVIGNPFIAINANIRRRKINIFLKKHIKMTEWISKDSLKTLNKNFEVFIVGSDQVWNIELSGYDSTYFLDFVENDRKRISYAASIGKEYISGLEYDLMEKNFPLYSAISVREKKASELIEQYFGQKPDVVLDPTMLRDKKFWYDISNESQIKIKKKYILIYAVQQPTNLLDVAVKVAKENDYDVISIFGNDIQCKHKTIRKASIEDFYDYIRNAECTFVTSFHGLVFSILFNTKFYYELAKTIPNNNSRLIDLCEMLGVQGQEIVDSDSIPQGDIDWSKVNEKLEIERRKSVHWLKKAISDQL